MPIFHRYLIREVLRVAVIVMVAVVAVYVAVDFFEKVDNFLEKGVALDRILVYLGYKLPFIVAQVFPLCLLLSVLIAFGLMNKHNEVMALRAGGIGTQRLMGPALALGFFSSILLFFIAETIVPPTMDLANRIWLGEVRQKAIVVSDQHNLWIKGHRSIVFIQHYHTPSRTAYGLTVNRFDEAFTLIERVDAGSAHYRDGKWHLRDVMVQERQKETAQMQVSFHPTMSLSLDLSPEDLGRAGRASSEMGFSELRRYVRRVAAEGYNAAVYRVDLHAKLAFPAICLILAMIGGGIGLHRLARESLVLATALGLGLAFLYWVFYSFCLSLGYGEMLPPVVAAWAANLVFGCLGGLAMLGTD